jgi:hypothetical protein
MPQHWIFRVGDGSNFYGSRKHLIWGIKTVSSDGKCFVSRAEPGDIIWFLTNHKAGKKLIAVATFTKIIKREIGPLISLTLTNEELGWSEGSWDTEVHYSDLYMIEDLEMTLTVSLMMTVVRTTTISSDIDFQKEYDNIVKYSKVKRI